MKKIVTWTVMVLGALFAASTFATENVMDSRTYLLDQSNKENAFPDFGGPYVEVLIEYIVDDEIVGNRGDFFKFTVTPLVGLSGESAGVKSFAFNSAASACPFGGVIPMDNTDVPEGWYAGVSSCFGNNNYNTMRGFGEFDAIPSAFNKKSVVETLVFTVDTFDYDHDNDSSTPAIPVPIDFYAVAGEGGAKEGAWSFAVEVIGIDGRTKSAIFAGHP